MSIAPLTCTALAYLWTLADNGRITRYDAFVGTKMCSRVLNSPAASRLKRAINIGNLTQKQFVDAYADTQLVDWELEALYHAFTR